MGALRSVFGRDNLRDASRESARSSGSGGSGRSRSLDDFKNRSTGNTAIGDSSSGSMAIEQVGPIRVDESGGELSVDIGKEDVWGKEKEVRRKRRDSNERGRSRSKKGEGRKLHLWEEV